MVVCLVAWAPAVLASGADDRPAQLVDPPASDAAGQTPEQHADPPPPDTRQHTYDMPPVDVYGKAPLREDDRIGDYAQPRWTADRLFGETRVYVIPKGKVEFEYWAIPETARDGTTDLSNMYEVEFGLPGHFQIDLYAVSHKTNLSGPMSFSEQKAEVRWAFADWGKLWGNPTLYLEYTSLDSAYDHLEGKLLLAGDIASGWHWGSNFVLEHELGGAQENSNEWTVGISHTVRDSKFDLGVETQLAILNGLEPDTGVRGIMAREFLAGPSLQLRPMPQMHINIASLIGTTHDSSRSKIFVVLGYEF